MKNVQVLTQKILDCLNEVRTYSRYKDALSHNLDFLFSEYQKGRFSYFEYEREEKRLLKGKKREEVLAYYDAYIESLLKRIETYNSQLFYEAYNDLRCDSMGIETPIFKPVSRPAPKPEPVIVKPAQKVEQQKVEHKVKPVLQEQIQGPASVLQVPLQEEVPTVANQVQKLDVKLVDIKPSIVERIALYFRHLSASREIKKQLKAVSATAGKPATTKPAPIKRLKVAEPDIIGTPHKQPSIVRKKSLFSFMLSKPKPSIVEKKEEKPAAAPQEEATIEMGKAFGIDYIMNLVNRNRKVRFSEKSEIPLSTLQLETLRRKAKPEIEAQIEKITSTALTKEATRIRAIMERRKVLKIYQPSFFGAVANLAIKRISLFLLDNFPDFFKDLYHALRLANIKVLSNTYVNMMVLGVISSFFLGLVLFGFFFLSTPLPGSQVAMRTILMAFISAACAFAGFYAYPYSKLKSRRRSINTNLPFAINHMAAVAGSGVSPVRMFKLISESREYGEISSEIEKIVNYVDVFGYDILSAIKAVANTTPSVQFKDFFEGMISCTQTGGDLKAYLSQKSEEAMINYKLERQKYTETISTYSDIYTGILIAAPLFFVASLSMVSLLGGKVGGMNVNVLIVIGTYVVIPILNVGFLMFLELTQPEV